MVVAPWSFLGDGFGLSDCAVIAANGRQRQGPPCGSKPPAAFAFSTFREHGGNATLRESRRDALEQYCASQNGKPRRLDAGLSQLTDWGFRA